MDRKVYMLLFGGLPANPTGIATSVIRRSNALVKYGTPCEILVNEYYIDYDDQIDLLRRLKKLDDNVNIRFMWNDYAYDTQYDDREVIQHLPEEEGFVVIQDSQRKNVYRCYKDGLYLKFKWFNENGNLHFVDHLNPNFIREKREWYDSKGYVRKVEYMDPTTNNPSRVIHYNKKGKCFLSISKNPKNKKITHILWFGKNGEYVREFKNESEMTAHWLESFILTNNKESILISEYGFHHVNLSKLEKKMDNLSVIYAFHNNHFAAPYDYGSTIRPDQKDFLSHLYSYSATVFLTQEQREDIINQFGNPDKIFTIPHYAPEVKFDKEILREDKTVVLVGRYEAIKGQGDAILAFKKVVEQIPEARLELYGRGIEEINLKKIILDNNLENNVFLMGFTDNSHNVFRKATISLIPSKYEGICLSLMESMACGCPTISYNFKYGPKDIIKDGVNGVIVPRGDIDSLAENIIDLLNSPDKRELLSKEATKITQTYSEERLVKEWNSLFEYVTKNR